MANYDEKQVPELMERARQEEAWQKYVAQRGPAAPRRDGPNDAAPALRRRAQRAAWKRAGLFLAFVAVLLVMIVLLGMWFTVTGIDPLNQLLGWV